MPDATVPATQVPAVEVDVAAVDVDVDVGGRLDGVDVVLSLLVLPEVVVVCTDTVVVGVTLAVPSEGVAEQVETCKPAVRETRPSWPKGSENPAGSVPT